jgi:hypothetical protein
VVVVDNDIHDTPESPDEAIAELLGRPTRWVLPRVS